MRAAIRLFDVIVSNAGYGLFGAAEELTDDEVNLESVDKPDAPLHMVLGSQALRTTIERLEERVAAYKTQTETAMSTDIIE